MRFEVEKIENCFAQSQTYQYTLPVDGNQMTERLPDWNLRINRKLRRPTAIGERNGVVIKFILAGNQFRVSFPDGDWQKQKAEFERFLETLPWNE